MDKETLDLIIAEISNGRTDIVRTLVKLTENVIEGDRRNPSPFNEILNEIHTPDGTLLHLSTKLDHLDVVRTLLSAGADPTIKNSDGESPYDLIKSEKMATVYVDELVHCAATSKIERIRHLVLAGVDVNSIDSPESKNTALHWAASFGNVQAIHCLLELGASPNVINSQGVTPLDEAIKRKNNEMVKILLDAGANPLIKNNEGNLNETILKFAQDDEQMNNLFKQYMPSFFKSKNNVEDSLEVNDKMSKNDLEDLNESLKSFSVASIDSSTKPNTTPSYSLQSLCVPSLLSLPLPLITDSKLHLLWPQPQHMVQKDGYFFKLKDRYSIQIVQNSTEASILDIFQVWESHRENFETIGTYWEIDDIIERNISHQVDIVCNINQKIFTRKENYKIIIDEGQIRIVASDILGLHYALCTLGQLFKLYNEDKSLPSLFIHDWPRLHHRAVLLDFSVNARKPTLKTLKGYLHIMSQLKIKQLHCYFRYDSNAEFQLPYSNKELIDISIYCAQHYIQVIPAIDVSNPIEHDQIKTTYIPAQSLMTKFSSNEVQVGPNLTKMLLQILTNEGPEKFWQFLDVPSSSIIYLCASSIPLTLEVTQKLPLNCILVEYGYHVEHDYDHNSKFFTNSGFNVCIGTGTSSWGSIGGCPETAISSIHKASQAASLYGSYGLIIADWKTLPHHPAFCFSWPGIVISLGLAWNMSVHVDYLHARLSELLSYFVFQDKDQITSFVAIELGRLEAFMHQSLQNVKDTPLLSSIGCSIPHQLLSDPNMVALENFTLDALQQALRHLKKFELDLQKAKPLCFQSGELISELKLALDLLLFTCKLARIMVSNGLNPTSGACGFAVINVGLNNLPPIARTDLANRLLGLIEQFRAVWLSRNLPCGLPVSLYMFNTLLSKLIPGNDQLNYDSNGDIHIMTESNNSNEIF